MKMYPEDMVKGALSRLINDGSFYVERISQDDMHFGNMYIALGSSSHVNIRFVKDRDSSWCEIGQAGAWYFVEDVVSLLDVSFVDESEHFVEYVKLVAELISSNASRIFSAFGKENSAETHARVKAFAGRRSMVPFGTNRG